MIPCTVSPTASGSFKLCVTTSFLCCTSVTSMPSIVPLSDCIPPCFREEKCTVQNHMITALLLLLVCFTGYNLCIKLHRICILVSIIFLSAFPLSYCNTGVKSSVSPQKSPPKEAAILFIAFFAVSNSSGFKVTRNTFSQPWLLCKCCRDFIFCRNLCPFDIKCCPVI